MFCFYHNWVGVSSLDLIFWGVLLKWGGGVTSDKAHLIAKASLAAHNDQMSSLRAEAESSKDHCRSLEKQITLVGKRSVFNSKELISDDAQQAAVGYSGKSINIIGEALPHFVIFQKKR